MMAKKPSEENDFNQPQQTADMPLDKPRLDSPMEAELESTESGVVEANIAQEETSELMMDDIEAVMGEEDSAVGDMLDDEPEEADNLQMEETDDALGEDRDVALDEAQGDEPGKPVDTDLDEDIEERPDEEAAYESEPAIEVEPSPYFPRGIYEDAWSVEAYYGRERSSAMVDTQDHGGNKMVASGKKRLRILLVALAFLVVLALIFLAVTGRIYLPF